jgi:hypothetical protein
LSNVDFDSNNFTIYPNPSNGNVTISFSNSTEKYAVQIVSVLGQIVFEKEYNNSTSAVVGTLPIGTYVVKITNGSNSVAKKLIVN